MRRSLLGVSAVALGLVAAASVPAVAGPILLPVSGSIAAVSATSSASGQEVDRVVFLLNGSGFSGIWSGGGGASICLGCFGGPPAPSSWQAGGGNPFSLPTSIGGGNSSSGSGGQVPLPVLLASPLVPATLSFTVPFEVFGTLNGYDVFGRGELLFSSSGAGGLATGAPFQSSEAPEPASLVLLSTGASALFLAARRRRRAGRS